MTTVWTEYFPVWAEMTHFKPELMLLALSITTFYRRRFSFQSQGLLVLISLMTYLCVRLPSSPLTLTVAAAILAKSLAGRDGLSPFNIRSDL